MKPEDLKDLEQWQALEDRKFRCSLIQQRLVAGLTVNDLSKAMNCLTDTIRQVEDDTCDPSLSTLRRYAAAVGAVYRHTVIPIPPKEQPGP